MKYFLICFICIYGFGLNCQNLTIKIEKGNTMNTLKDQIEKQSDYKLAYAEEISSQLTFNIEMDYENISISDLIKELNHKLPHDFKALGNNITIKPHGIKISARRKRNAAPKTS